MSIITKGNNIYFWFDHDKPRREEGRQEALRRWAEARGDKKIHRKAWHSIHHWADRSNGAAYNLFVCESQEQHNKLHSQLQEMAETFIKSGLVKVCLQAKKYIINNPYLVNWLKQWQSEGEPNRHDPNYRSS